MCICICTYIITYIGLNNYQYDFEVRADMKSSDFMFAPTNTILRYS